MPDLTFQSIHHRYASDEVLKGVSLSAKHAEITCLLGASGCGKTTLLRLAAGLLKVQSGDILLGDVVLATAHQHPPPEERPIGLVFQEGALFPHMTVAENVGFGLRRSGDSAARVRNLLELVGLSGFDERYPDTLSGGQQQRVSLARALAPAPEILLLDEPFANIDLLLRRELRSEMRRIIKATGTTAILVTHDPEEALDMADQIAVMEAGKIVQVGDASSLRTNPQALAVAQLVGGLQTVTAQRVDGQLETDFGVWSTDAIANDLPDKNSLLLAVRKEGFDVSLRETGAQIADLRPEGDHIKAIIQSDTGATLAIVVPVDMVLEVGDKISVLPKPQSAFAFVDKLV